MPLSCSPTTPGSRNCSENGNRTLGTDRAVWNVSVEMDPRYRTETFGSEEISDLFQTSELSGNFETQESQANITEMNTGDSKISKNSQARQLLGATISLENLEVSTLADAPETPEQAAATIANIPTPEGVATCEFSCQSR